MHTPTALSGGFWSPLTVPVAGVAKATTIGATVVDVISDYMQDGKLDSETKVSIVTSVVTAGSSKAMRKGVKSLNIGNNTEAVDAAAKTVLKTSKIATERIEN